MASEQATYTHGHHESVVQSHSRRTVENSAAFLIPHIQPHHKILDTGCGPGSISVGLARLASQGEVIGGDVVEEVLADARELSQEQNVKNISFQQLDANALPFSDAEFDVTFCHQVLQHVGDPVAILKEMRRVTKPGGIVAARDADFHGFVWFPETKGLDQWMDIYQKVAKANGAQPNAGRYLPSWAVQAGFAREAVTFSWDIWNYQDADARVFGASWVDRVRLSGFAKSAQKHSFADQDLLQSLSHAWEEWTKTEGAFIIIPNGEILCRV